jgi:hypothetical protein
MNQFADITSFSYAILQPSEEIELHGGVVIKISPYPLSYNILKLYEKRATEFK